MRNNPNVFLVIADNGNENVLVHKKFYEKNVLTVKTCLSNKNPVQSMQKKCNLIIKEPLAFSFSHLKKFNLP